MSDVDNTNFLLKLLKARLQSEGKASQKDTHGNIVFVDCDIFATDQLVSFLELSISEFNQCPKFTNFTLSDDKFVKTFAAILVTGAAMYALGSKALIERGREFKIEDNGLYFDPPSLAELMNTQYCTMLIDHHNKLKDIKDSIDHF
jgi:hypothetical protein